MLGKALHFKGSSFHRVIPGAPLAHEPGPQQGWAAPGTSRVPACARSDPHAPVPVLPRAPRVHDARRRHHQQQRHGRGVHLRSQVPGECPLPHQGESKRRSRPGRTRQRMVPLSWALCPLKLAAGRELQGQARRGRAGGHGQRWPQHQLITGGRDECALATPPTLPTSGVVARCSCSGPPLTPSGECLAAHPTPPRPVLCSSTSSSRRRRTWTASTACLGECWQVR